MVVTCSWFFFINLWLYIITSWASFTCWKCFFTQLSWVSGLASVASNLRSLLSEAILSSSEPAYKECVCVIGTITPTRTRVRTCHAGAVVVDVLSVVVARALLGVAEHAVSLAHFLEAPLLFAPLRVRRARVPVRVVYQSTLPVTSFIYVTILG